MIEKKFFSRHQKFLTLLVLVLFSVAFLTGCSRNAAENNFGMASNSLPGFDISNFVDVTAFGVSALNADNTQALQNAINANEQIYIPAGTYMISKPLTKLSGRLIIKGDNAVLKLVTFFPKNGGRFTGALVLDNLRELQIDGLGVDGNRGELVNAGRNWKNYIMGMYITNSTNVTLNNCTVKNGPSISFSIRSSSNVLVSNCTSVNGMFHGVELDACTNATIDKFHYTGIGNQGNNATIGGIGILGTVCNHVKIQNCFIEDCPDTGTKTEGSNDVTWEGNTVKNSGKDGIKFMNHYDDGFHPEVGTVYNARIINNTVDKIYNGRRDGSSEIQVWNAQNVVVSNNNISGGSKSGMEDGIQVWANTGVTKNITVSNNHIVNTNRFIYISQVSDVQIDGNICENNIDPVTENNGFEAERSNHFTVTGNSFKRNGTTAINGAGAFIYNCADFTFSGNSVINANRGLQASFLNSQTVDLSKNTWENLGGYFASLGVNSSNSIQNLLLNDNVVSKVATGPFLFKIDSKNLSLNRLNLKNTKVLGNGSNNRWGIEIPDGGTISETDLTNFATTGFALYPQLTALKGCKRIVGLKSSAPPRTGTWAVGDIVFNFSITSIASMSGWVCVTAGSPGIWKAIY